MSAYKTPSPLAITSSANVQAGILAGISVPVTGLPPVEMLAVNHVLGATVNLGILNVNLYRIDFTPGAKSTAFTGDAAATASTSPSASSSIIYSALPATYSYTNSTGVTAPDDDTNHSGSGSVTNSLIVITNISGQNLLVSYASNGFINNGTDPLGSPLVTSVVTSQSAYNGGSYVQDYNLVWTNPGMDNVSGTSSATLHPGDTLSIEFSSSSQFAGLFGAALTATTNIMVSVALE